MWTLKRRISLKDSGIFNDFTDWHSHILPGVDDGVRTMEESLDILHTYEQLGIKEVWLTPHIMEDVPNTTDRLRQRFGELCDAYSNDGRCSNTIILHLAAENMLDNLFEERLKNNDLLPLGENGDHLLVETSYFSPPTDLTDILSRIKSKGYYPVLAHPERYVYMEQKDYALLRSMDIRFQLNIFSLVGMYGHDVQKKAEHLLKQGYYDRTGTDIHSFKTLQRCLSAKINKSTIGNLNF